MKIHILTLILIACITTSVSAETMQGGNYTLNGSVEVMVNQGAGGTYVLNPSGDPLGTSASGGSFVLYPTPFSFKPEVAEVLDAVVRSVTYGSSIDAAVVSREAASTSSSTSPSEQIDQENQENLGPGIIIGPNGVPGYYNENGEFIPSSTGTNYGYPNATDTVNFGRGTSTAGNGEEDSDLPMSPIAKTFSWLIVIIILFAIIRRIWDKIQGRI